MGSRSPETQIKRARELALKEQRERKQAKKDARAAEKLRALEEGPLDGEARRAASRWRAARRRRGAAASGQPPAD